MKRAIITGDVLPPPSDENTQPSSRELKDQIEAFKMSMCYSIIVSVSVIAVFIITVVVLNVAYTPMGN